jgi:hypothetical protein
MPLVVALLFVASHLTLGLENFSLLKYSHDLHGGIVFAIDGDGSSSYFKAIV